ncbi:MAG: phenylalanine--tRNA ligase subunit alpha, partial [Sulfuriferula sp.]
MQNLDTIVAEALTAFSSANQGAELDQAKSRYLGKSGLLTEQLKQLGKLPAAERPAAGNLINQAKEQIQQA